MWSWSKYYAIKNRFDKNNLIEKKPGIYVWLRCENGINYFYVGQAKNLHERRWEYYQIQCGLAYPKRHFEASLKKHKDWGFFIIELCPVEELDEREQKWIKHYMAQPNYVTRNEILTGENKVVQSNAKRLERIDKKWENKISKCIQNVYASLDSNGLNIKPYTKKDGAPTKKSLKYFNELLEILKVGK